MCQNNVKFKQICQHYFGESLVFQILRNIINGILFDIIYSLKSAYMTPQRCNAYLSISFNLNKNLL